MYEVISVQDILRWKEILDSMRIRDVYYSSHYFLSALSLDPGEALMFYYSDQDGSIAYPFIKRRIEGKPSGYFDITTPFGYGGPVVRGDGNSDALVARFMEAFSGYCRDEHIIAEYIRFHPLLGNAAYFENHLKLLPLYETYTIDLKKAAESAGNSPISTQQEQGIVIRKLGTVRHMFEFLVLYYGEMRRREEADSYYFFTQDYFEALVSNMGPILHLFGAYRNQKLISASYILAEGDTIYQHLDGALEGEEKSEAAKTLLLKIEEWGADNNMAFYHLGGDFKMEGDNNLPVKNKIANMQPSMFYICEKIHDASIYRKLIVSEEKDTVKRYRNV
ncbi:MAG TPA: GNAT family N-acetyltransferase [Planococcus sp. (in: firmicutes)]|nr:GNAT family N-acetyltransferase [Planococcus sp. (in: firmicutes)]